MELSHDDRLAVIQRLEEELPGIFGNRGLKVDPVHALAWSSLRDAEKEISTRIKHGKEQNSSAKEALVQAALRRINRKLPEVRSKCYSRDR